VRPRVVLAVDGGNSKTDLALVREDGALLGLTRGPMGSPQHLGVERTVALLDDLLAGALRQAGRNGARRRVADVGYVLLAGLDFPSEEERLRASLQPLGWAHELSVGNDTFAILRAGTERGWGVAVVCGAGINCVGVGPDGRHARFPALGAITGDWGGGYDVGMAALSAAARSEDGRGPRTSLEHAVPAHFGLRTPVELAEAVHERRVDQRRVVELAPVVFAEAARDPVAAALVARLVDEIATFVEVAVRRLELVESEPVDVVLGGGMLQHAAEPLLDAIRARLAGVRPALRVRPTATPAIVGAALLGLDALGAGPAAQRRARSEIGAAFQNGQPAAGVLAGAREEG
jgi:N-acetylglucosamine kinase-like BadF-type ATPase